MSLAQTFYFAAAVFVCAVAAIVAMASLFGGFIPAWHTDNHGEVRDAGLVFCKSVVVGLVSAGVAASMWGAP